MKTQKYVYIKRQIEIDDYLREFIFFNINYRRKIWNLFVEEYYRCKESDNPDDSFDVNMFTTKLIWGIDYEIGTSEEYSKYYASDIVKSVSSDVKATMKLIANNYKKEHQISKLRFKSFDKYRGSFKVRNENKIYKNYGLQGKIHIKNNKKLIYRASSIRTKNHLNIIFKEPLFDEELSGYYCYFNKNDRELQCYFRDSDIRTVVFTHEMGKFYIALSINMTYINNKKDIKNRKSLAGIDLGIHNPITLYDGEKTYSFRMSDKELNKIHYLERRCKRLQNIMDRKMLINKKRHKQNKSYNIYTKSYERVRRKFRRSWKRIQDIRCNWRRKIAKFIATHFQTIVVDEMVQPPKDEHLLLPRKVSRYINHFNREHAVYSFNECLKHTCIKFGCEYVKAEKYTTRTCCLCGHINPKLPISKRILQCEECGNKIDRDKNAAINCYDFYQNR